MLEKLKKKLKLDSSQVEENFHLHPTEFLRWKRKKNEQKDSEKQFWRSKTESFAKMLFQMICDTFRVISN